MVTNILLIIIILELGFNIYLYYKNLSPEKKLEVVNKFTNNETVIMDWQAPESDEEIAFKESLKKLDEMRKI
jgi:hypothetical protein